MVFRIVMMVVNLCGQLCVIVGCKWPDCNWGCKIVLMVENPLNCIVIL